MESGFASESTLTGVPKLDAAMAKTVNAGVAGVGLALTDTGAVSSGALVALRINRFLAGLDTSSMCWHRGELHLCATMTQSMSLGGMVARVEFGGRRLGEVQRSNLHLELLLRLGDRKRVL